MPHISLRIGLRLLFLLRIFVCGIGLGGCFGVVGVASASAATSTQTTSFTFPHTGSVSTGLISLGGYFTNTTASTSAALAVPKFDASLGRLTKATVTVTTTTATFQVAPTGLLSLASGQTATRALSYAFAAGTTAGSGTNSVTTNGATLLTLLSIGGAEIGGAPLAASSVFTALSDLANLTGSGSASITLTASDTLATYSLVSALNGAGLTGSGTYAGSVSVAYDYVPWNVSGYAFLDADHNGLRGAAEAGTGLVLYAKLLSSSGLSGPALQAVAADPTTGLYAFAVGAGSYRIILDDNATLSDVTALQVPAGWSSTRAAGFTRDVTIAGNPPTQDFGLIHATQITGRLFIDDGRGSGTGNDGAKNGSESGLPSRTMQLRDAGGALIDTATTAGDGSYSLYSTANAGAVVQVCAQADNGWLVTGASPGTSSGTFSRTAAGSVASVAITQTMGSVTGVDIGVIPAPTLTMGATQTVTPGTVAFYRHTFTATSTSHVAFTVMHSTAVSPAPWAETLYLDANANGTVDASDSVVSTSLALTAGQTVALIVKVAIPEGAAMGSKVDSVVAATVTFDNAAPALGWSLSRSNVTLIGAADLALAVVADASASTPGGTITYTITFTNVSSAAITSLVVNDQTPAYTSFASATVVSIPASLTLATTTFPAAGAKGGLQWNFNGQLQPGASGSLRFAVQVD